MHLHISVFFQGPLFRLCIYKPSGDSETYGAGPSGAGELSLHLGPSSSDIGVEGGWSGVGKDDVARFLFHSVLSFEILPP